MRGEPEPPCPPGWTQWRHAASEPGRLGNARRVWGGRHWVTGTMPRLNAVEKRMLVAAAAVMPREACGALILDEGNMVHFFEFENHSQELGQFRIPDAEVLALHRRQRDRPGSVFALWHSHPFGSPIPSERDLQYHPSLAANLVLALPRESEVRYFRREPAGEV